MKHLAEVEFLNLVEDNILSNSFLRHLVADPLGVKDLLYSSRKTTF